MNKNIKISYNVVHEIDKNLELIKELKNQSKFTQQNFYNISMTKSKRKEISNNLTRLFKQILHIDTKFKKPNGLLKFSPTVSKIITNGLESTIDKTKSAKTVLNCKCNDQSFFHHWSMEMTWVTSDLEKIISYMKIYRELVKNTIDFCNKEFKLNSVNKK